MNKIEKLQAAQSTRQISWILLICFQPISFAMDTDYSRATLETPQSEWRLCPPDRLKPEKPRYSNPTIALEKTEIRAESTRLVRQGINHFHGDVEIIKGSDALRAETVTYDERSQIFTAEGRAHLWGSGLTWAGNRLTTNLSTDISELQDGKYWLENGRGHGKAKNIVHDKIGQKTLLTKLDYSTCPDSDKVWRISAGTLKLNHENDRGSATNAVLHLRNVPVFYFPYVNFPLNDKRKSGFLAPTFGTSNESGFDAETPYYFNIAPNYDATLTPRYITDRGALLDTEFRYLENDFQGEIKTQYLPGDDLHEGEDRSLVDLEHYHWFAGRRGRVEVQFKNVSDDEYFQDFGGGLGQTSQRILDRFARFRYKTKETFVRGSIDAPQVVDQSISSDRKPYRKLPQLSIRHNLPYIYGFRPRISAQGTYFDNSSRVHGTRLSLDPSIEYQYRKSFLNIRPKIRLKHTEYFIDDPNRTFRDNPSYTVPIFDIDAQLFMERGISFFNSSYIQTFEPRIYYLAIPNVHQDDIPIFDTGDNNLSFPALFRSNRFRGGDRVGDANQVTTAITSRLLDIEQGLERLRLSVGQIYYFRDRKITRRENQPISDDNLSELIAEVAGSITQSLNFRGNIQWDPEENQRQKSVVSLRYRPNTDTAVNISYRYRRARTDIEQTDISLRIPITERLALIGKWNYSLPRKSHLEAFAGLEYESCCWGVRIVGRRFLKGVEVNTEGEEETVFDNGAFLEFQLKGLGGIGRRSASILRRGIRGYEDPFD